MHLHQPAFSSRSTYRAGWLTGLTLSLALALLLALHYLAVSPPQLPLWLSSAAPEATQPEQPSQPINQPRLTSPTDFPSGLYPAYLAARQSEGGQSYQIQTQPGAGKAEISANNPEHNFTAKFSTQGVEISGLTLKLERVGYLATTKSATLQDITLNASSQFQASGNRLEYARGAGLTEWFVNGPLGLEQGFTLDQPLPGTPSDQLEIELALSGLTSAELTTSDSDSSLGKNVRLNLASGQTLEYGALYVYDAKDKVYPAHFRLTPASDKNSEYQLGIIVSDLDNNVAYPLTIDPIFVQTQMLTASNGAANDFFGYAIALSSDGNTALIGAYSKTFGGTTSQGAAYIFTRTGSTAPYVQSQMLSAYNGAAYDQFGHAVALSSDGNTVLIGAYHKDIGDKIQQGAAYVFTRTNSTALFNQVQMLTINSATLSDFFGYAVALSSDGNTALIGAFNNTEAAYVFTRTGTGKPFAQAQMLTANNHVLNDRFGYSVALSSDGNTALIGAYHKTSSNINSGAVYVFTRSGFGTLYTQAQMFTATNGVGGDEFGGAVALSGDGNTALIGAPRKTFGTSTFLGAAYIFTRTGFGAPFIQTQMLTAPNSASFGYTVALSSDGNTALIGIVKAYVFTRSGFGTPFIQTQILLPPATAAIYGLALSSDASTALIGDSFRNSWQGATFVFRLAPDVVLTASASSLALGQSLLVTATLTFPNPAPTADTATFYLDNSPVNTQTVPASGVITYMVNSPSLGNHTVYARYNAGSYPANNSAPLLVTVQVSQINFSSASYTVSETVGTAVFTVTRTGSFFGKAVAQIQVINQTTDARDYQIPLPGSLDTTFGDAGVVGKRVRRIIVQPDGKIIIAGTFSQVGGQNRSSIARLNSDSTLDTSFNSAAGVTSGNLDGTIYEMALQPDGKILVAGIFDKASGQTHNNIARFNPDGTLDNSFNPSLNDYVLGLHLQPSGKILVGGDFTQVNGQAHTRIVRLNSDGSLDSAFSPTASADAVVRTFVTLPDDKIYVGGEFSQLNGQARTRFARLNPDGTLDTTFSDLALNGNVFRAAGLPSGKVLLGGTFTQAGGQTHNRLVQLNPDGTLDTSFTAGTNDYVAELEVTRSGKLVILGLFTQVNGVPQGGVAQLYPDGTLDTSYTDLGLGGQAFALGIQANDAIVIGGEFTQVIGFPRHLVARVYGNFGEVSWEDGEGGDRLVRMPIVNDAIAEGSETFVLTVTNPINLVPIAPSSAVVTILDSTTVFTVTQPTDDGSGQVANSLSWALLQTQLAGQNIAIQFNVAGGVISVSGALPVVKPGMYIDGGVSGIIIDGNGLANDGLQLAGNNKLSNLTIRHFAGRELVALGTSNKLYGVRLES